MSEEHHDERHAAPHERRRQAHDEPAERGTPTPAAAEPTPALPPEPAPEIHPEPKATPPEAPVESLLGLRDYLAVAPRYRSASVTQAAYTAMQRWMQLHGHDVNGFYSMAQWQEHYGNAMKYTG